MNTKLITILVACTFIVGCNKTPTQPIGNNSASQPPPPPVQAEPFHGQVYKSLNGRTVLTLTSKDECDLTQDGTTLPCKYTKQADALRVIATVMGTPQVIYFRFVDQGLQDNNGNVLLSPERFAEIQKEIQLKQKEEQLKAQREQEEENNAKRETRIISTYALSPTTGAYTDENDPAQLILTDASLKLSRLSKAWIVGFADITDIQTVHEIAIGGYGFQIDFGGTYAFFRKDSAQEANDIHNAVVNSYKAWVKQFPKYCRLRSDSALYKEIQNP